MPSGSDVVVMVSKSATVIATDVVLLAPRLSEAVNVIWCVPGDRSFLANDVPLPSTPSMLLSQPSAAPASEPSSGSCAEPANSTGSSERNWAPSCGLAMLTSSGGWLACTVTVTVSSIDGAASRILGSRATTRASPATMPARTTPVL